MIYLSQSNQETGVADLYLILRTDRQFETKGSFIF